MYKIEFADGSTLDNLELNGNNFISAEPIEPEFFKDEMLTSVSFVGPEFTGTVPDMKLIQCVPWENGSAFILAEISMEEKRQNLIKSILEQNSTDITDIQSALAELYETFLGGI